MTPLEEILAVIDGDSEGCVVCGDALDMLKLIPDGSVQTCVSSPPYWGLRNYNVDGQIGLEKTPEEYVTKMVEVFGEVRRVLRDDGTVWLNMGDCYNGSGNPAGCKGKRCDGGQRAAVEASNQLAFRGKGINVSGLKPKDLCGIPWRVAFALQADGWYLRQDIVWSKPNPMPESVTDRCTKAHEYIFLLAKNQKYYYDAEAIRDPVAESTIERLSQPTLAEQAGSGRVPGKMNGPMKAVGEMVARNKRSVWTITTQPYPEAHFATFPQKLVEPCIMAGTSEKGRCPKCGAPWIRVLEKERIRTRPGENSKSYDRRTGEIVDDGMEKPWRDRAEIGNRDPGRHVTESKTVGWQPQCECGGEPVSCIVLDPFIGSGTVAKVAAGLGRDYIGIELNPEYAAMARKRVYGPLFGGADMAARGIDHA